MNSDIVGANKADYKDLVCSLCTNEDQIKQALAIRIVSISLTELVFKSKSRIHFKF